MRKRIFKILKISGLVLFLLPFICFAILNLGVVQVYIAQYAAARLSKDLHTEISIGSISIHFFNRVSIHNITVKDLHGNNLLKSNQIDVSVASMASIKTKTLQVKRLYLSGTDFNYIDYASDSTSNLQFLIDYFSSGDTSSTSSSPFTAHVGRLEFRDANIVIQDRHSWDTTIHGHADFSNLQFLKSDILMDNVEFSGGSLQADIKNISLTERSGFVLNKFQGKAEFNDKHLSVKEAHIETPHSYLHINFALEYDSLSMFSDFIDNVRFNTHFYSDTKVDMRDIVYWTDAVKGMDNIVNSLSGDVTGPVSDLRLKGMVLHYGESTVFKGDIRMKGLPDFDNTHFSFNIQNLDINPDDIGKFRLPSDSIETISIPSYVAKLGRVKVTGNLIGYYSNFKSELDIITEVGEVNTNIALKQDIPHKIFEYQGLLQTIDFDAGKILGIESTLGKITSSIAVQGSGLELKDMKVAVKGNVSRIDLLGNIYDSLVVDGKVMDKEITGELVVEDRKLKLDFDGLINLRDSVPTYDFTAKIAHANLSALKITSDTNVIFASDIQAKGEGSTIDNFYGNITLQNTKFIRNDKQLDVEKLTAVASFLSENYRQVDIISDFFTFNITGNFLFENLPAVFDRYGRMYFPVFFSTPETAPIAFDTNTLLHHTFEFNLACKNTEELTSFFIPDLKIGVNTTVRGNYNSDEKHLSVIANAGTISYQNIEANALYLNGEATSENLAIETGAEKLIASGVQLDAFKAKTSSINNHSHYQITWTDTFSVNHSEADIKGFIVFEDTNRFNLGFDDAKITIQDNQWIVNKDNMIRIEPNVIDFHNLSFQHKDQSFSINGKATDSSHDSIYVKFNNCNLGLFDYLFTQIDFKVKGIINGSMNVYNLFSTPNFVADLTIKNFNLNGEMLGDAKLQTTLAEGGKALFSKVQIAYQPTGQDIAIPLSVEGNYYLDKRKNNIDFKGSFKNFKLKSIAPLLSSITSEVEGLVSGNLTFTGSLEAPRLNGMLRIDKGKLKVDYLNTIYTFDNNLTFSDNSFDFNGFKVFDPKGNSAVINGYIKHKNFDNFVLDLTISPQNLLALNTKQENNDTYYGQAVVSGIVKIEGPVDDILMDMSLRTEKGTNFNLVFNDKTSVSENDFITFVQHDEKLKIETKPRLVSTSKMNIKMALDINENANVNMNIASNPINSYIKANGDGNLQINVNQDGDMQIFGDYVIDNGNYHMRMRLEGLPMIDKKFRIDKGSKLSWTGDPYTGTWDVKAIYQTNTTLAPLFSSTESQEAYGIAHKNMLVYSIIMLKDKIFTPLIQFDIDLPNASQQTKDLVYSVLDKNNEKEITQQTFSLLIFNSFMAQDAASNNQNFTSTMGASAIEAVTNQFSGILSNLLHMNVGLNYSSGDEQTNQQLDVVVSKSIWNDRITIDGNFGWGGNDAAMQQQAQNASYYLGDVNVNVRLTQDLSFKAFNRSNANDFTKISTPYTQGIGLSYRREFNSLQELFTKRKKYQLLEDTASQK